MLKPLLLQTLFLFGLNSVVLCQIDANTRPNSSKNVTGDQTPIDNTIFIADEDFDNFNVSKFKEQGILIFRRNRNSEGGNSLWTFDHYSDNFQKIMSTELKISDNYRLENFKETEDKLFLLFVNKKEEFKMIVVNIQDLQTKEITGVIPKSRDYNNFEVYGDNCFIYCYTNNTASFKFIDCKNSIQKEQNITLPGIKSSQIEFGNFQFDALGKCLFVINKIEVQKDLTVYSQRFDVSGNLIETVCLSEGLDKNLVNTSASFIKEGEIIYSGTYCTKHTAGSEGIYILKTNNSVREFCKFYNFTEFKEFFTYLTEKQQERLDKAKEKKEEKGKELISEHLIVPHNIQLVDGKYIFIGESYYPTYKMVYKTVIVNGKSEQKWVHEFDGFQYTHATIAAFDSEGNKTWDRAIIMDPYDKPKKPIKFIHVTENAGNQIGLVYAHHLHVNGKLFNSTGDLIEDKDYISDDLNFIKAEIYSTQFDYWYNLNFIKSGYAKIKEDEEGKQSKKVFFIRKVEFKT